ncbi:MAG: tetratricopeptide repeat protein [Armatimonadota bacterium]
MRRLLGSVDFRLGVALVVLVLAVFLQTIHFDFVNFDDDVYVENNPAVQSGLNRHAVIWALTTNYQANWHPLTWISLMVDTEVAKIATWLFDINLGRHNSGLYHLTNVIFHASNTVLLYVVLSAVTGMRWRSAFVAAVFAVHPLHVESVAWVSERKDVLSTLFWMLTMLSYVNYVRDKTTRSYWTVLVFYLLGLMSKPMLVSLPIILLLLDVWPLRRIQLADCDMGSTISQLLREKLPLFVLAIASCFVTLWAQHSGGAVARIEVYPLGVRVANALVSYIVYLVKMVCPTELSVLYLHPGRSLPVYQVMGSAIILVLVSIFAIKSVRSRPYVMVGWLWYIITLIPVIGLIQVGKQAMADRYTYVPLIGIFILMAWGLPDLFLALTGQRSRMVSAVLGCFALAGVGVLAVICYSAVGVWRNSITLFDQALKVDPTNSLAYNNLGNALVDLGEFDRAIECYNKALQYHPEYADARYNLAEAYRQSGEVDKAISEYKRVIRMYPKYIKARNNLGSLYALQGKYDLAIAEFEAALEVDPENPDIRRNLENARKARGRGL